MGRGRPVKPGISFYRFDSGHILNKKVRLLYNEYDSDGYYIWSCLLDKAYGEWGYYFDMNDQDELELFASEYCKKKLSLIQEVIGGCIRRGLFDQAVADLFGVLTSSMMQETFLVATSERRAKGTIFEMHKEWILIDSQDIPENISIVPAKKRNIPGNNSIVPPNNSQRRREKRIQENTREEENTPPPGVPGAAAPGPDLQELFKQVEKAKKPLYDFILAHRPDFIDPYIWLWNVFAGERGKPQILKANEARRKKFKTRIGEKAFDFLKILEKAGKAGDFLSTSNWFTWDWIMESEGNYLKVLEGNYDDRGGKPSASGAATIDLKALDYLYTRFLEGQLDSKVITEAHCNFLLQEGLIDLDERFMLQAVDIRIKNLTGSNQASELRMVQAYQAGTWPSDPDCQKDRAHLERIAKKFALYNLFQAGKQLQAGSIGELCKKLTHAEKDI